MLFIRFSLKIFQFLSDGARHKNVPKLFNLTMMEINVYNVFFRLKECF